MDFLDLKVEDVDGLEINVLGGKPISSYFSKGKNKRFIPALVNKDFGFRIKDIDYSDNSVYDRDRYSLTIRPSNLATIANGLDGSFLKGDSFLKNKDAVEAIRCGLEFPKETPYYIVINNSLDVEVTLKQANTDYEVLVDFYEYDPKDLSPGEMILDILNTFKKYQKKELVGF